MGVLNTSCACAKNDYEQVLLAHGGGGKLTQQLISKVFFPAFSNELLAQEHDGAIFNINNAKLACSTDSFVVDPIFFAGGDIGDLAINGTVNDIACCGAKPLYLTAGFIIEEGFPIEDLKRICASMQKAAQKANVKIVTGDTKVVEKGKCDKIFINTSGIGVIENDINIHPLFARPGDVIICNGYIAEHGVAIMAAREGLDFDCPVKSDTASLNHMIEDLLHEGCDIHVLRDPTRGGLSSTLNEIAKTAHIEIELDESSLPISEPVKGICEILGLDPLYIANEGKVLIIAPQKEAERILQIMHRHPEGKEAVVIGSVTSDQRAIVKLKNTFGGTRIVDMLSGEQLPRIC